ncbi:MAG: flagellar motor switch protein FliM [Lachnospiraceae bacterium]
MADVLSQSQIDALLQSMQSGEPVSETQTVVEKKTEEALTKYNKYDFYSPRKFTKEKMKILTSVFENYARILTSQVNGIFRVMTDITVLEVQECRYYEYINSFRENDCLTLVDVFLQEKGKNNVPLMMFITPGMVITLINRMLGGGDDIVKVDADYRYSDVEMALYRRVAEYFTQALKDGFANYINLGFKVQRVEENPSMFQDVGLDETVAIIHLNVDMAGQAVERIRLCIPGTLLEHIFSIIDHRKHIARGFSYEDNKEKILDNICYSQLPVTGQLGIVQLDVNDIYRLQVGDVIDLNKPKNGSVTLYVGRQPWFTGSMGRFKKNVAVRIQERIYEKKEDDEETFETGSIEDTPLESVEDQKTVEESGISQ